MRVCPECFEPLLASSRVPTARFCPSDFRDCSLSGRLLEAVAA